MEPSELILYCHPKFDDQFLPTTAPRLKSWWEATPRLRGHAKFCQPMLMANSLGLYIPSPATFTVSWNGKPDAMAQVALSECAPHAAVHARVAYGSFEVDIGFIPRTTREGEFIYIKGIPNVHLCPYVCLEALIEAWWNPARFSLVFMIGRASEFQITAGTPLAQMFVYTRPHHEMRVTVRHNYPEEHEAWEKRRFRPDYHRDLDYMRGLHPNGEREQSHIKSWPPIEWQR